ncbi:hypothetical protein A2U01_0039704 [Trifolium medium]|uniref:Uncharacterized protein n=1 Tax=Trifolium medium TaxID=97028 RepID=A0A392Q4A0_9FABA|nr:hypothetical protein [Trifolium medium]
MHCNLTLASVPEALSYNPITIVKETGLKTCDISLKLLLYNGISFDIISIFSNSTNK